MAMVGLAVTLAYLAYIVLVRGCFLLLKSRPEQRFRRFAIGLTGHRKRFFFVCCLRGFLISRVPFTFVLTKKTTKKGLSDI